MQNQRIRCKAESVGLAVDLWGYFIEPIYMTHKGRNLKKYIKNIIFLFFIMAFFFFPFQPLTAEENTISLSDAILQTLDINPRVKIEKNRLEQKEGRLQTASGQFDWMVKGTISHEERDKKATIDDMRKYINDYLNQPYSDTETDEATFYSLGLTKQFRNGITISPTVSALDSAHYDDFRLDINPINRSEYRVDRKSVV